MTDKITFKDQNPETFKTYWVKLSITEAANKRNEIKERLKWSTAVWFNKINGKTPITPAEKEIITEIFNDTPENIFNHKVNLLINGY